MPITMASGRRRRVARSVLPARWLIALGAIVLLFASPARVTAVQIEDIDALSAAASAAVTIQLSGAATYMARSLAADGQRPDRIYLDLHEAEVGSAPRSQELLTGPVRRIRSAQFDPKRARIVLDLVQPSPYQVEALEDPFRLVLRVGDRAVAGSGAASRAGRSAEPPTSASSAAGIEGGLLGFQENGRRELHHDLPASNTLSESSSPPSLDPLAGQTPTQTASPSRSAAQAAPPLVTARDRERLRHVAAAREKSRPREDYIIGPDDLLEIRIPDLSEDSALESRLRSVSPGLSPIAAAPTYHHGVRVSGSGEVTLPVLGSVPAAGYTPRELEQAIARLLVKRGILRRPDVSVFVAEYRSRFVSVVGEVERPGSYPLTGRGTTISDMIWAAGGPSREAGRVIEFAPARTSSRNASSTIGSGDDGPPADPIRIDFETLMQRRGDWSSDPPAWPGDVVNVPPAGSVNIDGWVVRPGAYDVTRGLTVAGAIAAAGGPEFPAQLRAVEILRTVGEGERRRFQMDIAAVRDGEASDVPVQDGDVIRVRASALRIVPWSVWTVARSMIHVGGSLLLF